MRKKAIIHRSIENRIFVIRGVKVLLDTDLAELYGVTVKRLNQQVAAMPSGFRKISCFNSLAKNAIL